MCCEGKNLKVTTLVLGTIDLVFVIIGSLLALSAPHDSGAHGYGFFVFAELFFAVICLIYLCAAGCNRDGDYYFPYLVFLVIRFVIGSLVGVAFLLGGIVMLLSGGLKHLSMDGQSGRITELEGVLLFGVVCFIGFLIALGWLALLIHLVHKTMKYEESNWNNRYSCRYASGGVAYNYGYNGVPTPEPPTAMV